MFSFFFANLNEIAERFVICPPTYVHNQIVSCLRKRDLTVPTFTHTSFRSASPPLECLVVIIKLALSQELLPHLFLYPAGVPGTVCGSVNNDRGSLGDRTAPLEPVGALLLRVVVIVGNICLFGGVAHANPPLEFAWGIRKTY